MKAVILAGGLGTRLSEETGLKPKPMVEIGGKPILWHIMKIYSAHGVNDFIICCGYKGYIIKEYFANYFLHMSHVTLNLRTHSMEVHEQHAEPWRVTLIDTGEQTMTGGRLKRIKPYLNGEDFCFTYGDGVSNVDISALIAFHNEHGKLATLTATQPPARFGALNLDNEQIMPIRFAPKRSGRVTREPRMPFIVDRPPSQAEAEQAFGVGVIAHGGRHCCHKRRANALGGNRIGMEQITSFQEKSHGDGAWINGGFFVLSPKVIDYIDSDATLWEREPMERLAQEGQFNAYRHDGFWQPMDTLRDKHHLEQLWQSGKAPWKIWTDE